MTNTTDAHAAIKCAVLYHYNTAPYAAIEAIYDNAVGPYIEEKAEVWRKGLSAFFGELDVEHQRRFTKLALDKYLQEVLGAIA